MFQIISKLGKRQRFTFDLFAILAFSILVTLPIYFTGIPGGADMPQHFQFAQTFSDAVASGEIYPSWAALPNGGNGDVGIRFYPPLTYYVFILFKAISGNWYDGVCLSFVLFFFLGGSGVFLWSKNWFSENASLFGAITYIFLPYHINQIYGAGMFAEFAAAAIIPFCFLFAWKVCQKGSLTEICGLAISFGLLILTHLPLAVICSILLPVYALFSLKKQTRVQALLKLSFAVLTGLLLSCFYWSRMLAELAFVNHNSEAFSSGHFSFKANFLLAKYFAFTGAESNPASDFNDTMLFVTLGILISGAIIYYIKTRETKNFQILNAAVMTLAALFMATPVSIKIWENFPLLQKTQFPWRWLVLVSLGASIFAAAAFEPLLEYYNSSKRYLAFIGFGIWMVCIPFNVTDVMNPLITYPKDYFNSLVERLKTTPSNDCWWTVWAKKSEQRVLAFSHRMADKVEVENRLVNIEKWNPTERIFNIGAGQTEQAFVATFYYPHWKATINGQPTEIAPTEDGLMTFSAPTEKSEVRIYFQEPAFVAASFYASGFMWIIILGFLIINPFRTVLFNKKTNFGNE